MKYFPAIIVGLSLLSSCQEEPEQKLEQLNNKSAREVTLTTATNGDTVYHITKQHIWYAGEKIAEKIDTIATPNKVMTWDTAAVKPTISKIPIYVTVQ